MHGREARLPIDVLLHRNDELPMGLREFHDHLVLSLNIMYEKVHHNIEYRQWLLSQHKGAYVPLPAYPVGSLVMHYTPTLLKGQTAMEAITWTGPHEVVEVTNGGLTYTVLEEGKPVKLHVGRLKRYVDGNDLGKQSVTEGSADTELEKESKKVEEKERLLLDFHKQHGVAEYGSVEPN